MARTTQQIETDIDNSTVIKLKEYLKDYLVKQLNVVVSDVDDELQKIFTAVNGLETIAQTIPKPQEPAATDPATANDGDLFFNTTDKWLKYYHDGTWHNLAQLSALVDLTPYAKTADVDTKLNDKADKTYVDTELVKKANSSELTTLSTTVASKSDTTYVDTELTKKQDKLTTEQLSKIGDALTETKAEIIYAKKSDIIKEVESSTNIAPGTTNTQYLFISKDSEMSAATEGEVVSWVAANTLSNPMDENTQIFIGDESVGFDPVIVGTNFGDVLQLKELNGGTIDGNKLFKFKYHSSAPSGHPQVTAGQPYWSFEGMEDYSPSTYATKVELNTAVSGKQDKLSPIQLHNMQLDHSLYATKTEVNTKEDKGVAYSKGESDNKFANINLSNIDQDGRNKIAGIADNHIFGIPNFESWDGFLPTEKFIARPGRVDGAWIQLADASVVNPNDYTNFNGSLTVVKLSNGTKEQIVSTDGTDYFEGNDGTQYNILSKSAYQATTSSITQPYLVLYFESEALRDAALANGLSDYYMVELYNESYDGGLFTKNAQNLTSNNEISVAPAYIGRKYKGTQSYGTVATGTQSYGTGATGTQFYGSVAKATQSYGYSAEGEQRYGQNAKAKQSYGSGAKAAIEIGSSSHGALSIGSNSSTSTIDIIIKDGANIFHIKNDGFYKGTTREFTWDQLITVVKAGASGGGTNP